jgi:hypothetical protein
MTASVRTRHCGTVRLGTVSGAASSQWKSAFGGGW